MHIVVVGVDHNTAPIAFRERLSCLTRQIPIILEEVRQVTHECVLLSTCNRIELYAVCDDAEQGRLSLLEILSQTRKVDYTELEAHSYSFVDTYAITHLFGVTSGLHSLIPGEPQIQGQVAEALEIAQGSGYAGPISSALFRAALGAGKRARSETGISRNAASISHVAVQLARHLLVDLRKANILLVGSGKMSELAARNLIDNGAQRLVIVNRTQTHAAELAQTLQASYRTFAELPEALVEADVVISSTKAPVAIMTLELMQNVLAQRAGRSLLLIDIALPRDVDEEVGRMPGVHLYNLDDLQSEVERGIHLRIQESVHVEAIIAEEVKAFERWLASLSVVDTISDLRQHVNALRQQELERTLKQLTPTLSEREIGAIQELATRLTNKLLHIPTLRLKEAAAAGQGHIYAEATRYLFRLEENNEQHESNNRHASQQTRHDTDAVGSPTIVPAVAQS